MKTGIFSLISRQRLQNVLETLHAYTELTLELLDAEGNLLMSFGDSPRSCTLMRTHVFKRNECVELKRKAGERAKQLGEAYIFTCHANLNHISFPLIHQGELMASIRVIVSRHGMQQAPMTFSGLVIDPAGRTVTADGMRLALTARNTICSSIWP